VTLRRLLTVLVSLALLGTLAVPASARVQASLASKGKGRQIVEGGGLTYGTVAKNSTVLIQNLSGLSDLTITIKGKPTKYAGGKLYVAKDAKGMAFKVSGSSYRLTLQGASSLNGIGVYGQATFRGYGTYSLSGGPDIAWGKGKVSLGDAAVGG
jgi:hypothetical protein